LAVSVECVFVLSQLLCCLEFLRGYALVLFEEVWGWVLSLLFLFELSLDYLTCIYRRTSICLIVLVTQFDGSLSLILSDLLVITVTAWKQLSCGITRWRTPNVPNAVFGCSKHIPIPLVLSSIIGHLNFLMEILIVLCALLDWHLRIILWVWGVAIHAIRAIVDVSVIVIKQSNFMMFFIVAYQFFVLLLWCVLGADVNVRWSLIEDRIISTTTTVKGVSLFICINRDVRLVGRSKLRQWVSRGLLFNEVRKTMRLFHVFVSHAILRNLGLVIL